MRQFENEVQLVKYQVLKEVARFAFEGTLEKSINKIHRIVDPGPEPRFRCCIYHERAITKERVHMALGGTRLIKNIVEVLDSACDKCLENRYVVTETCRGCLAHRCMKSCPVKAISMINGKAVIDYNSCIECGKCQSSCPYDAIADVMRPCKRVCPTNAISITKYKKAEIDDEKCIQCGACVYHCPFGAIQDKSQIVDVIDSLRKKDSNLYAIVAPAFASQYNYVDLGQVITGIKKLGFKDVVEVALGADLVVQAETEEFMENSKDGILTTSSCCPAFVNYVNYKYPKLEENISTTVSPMIATARLIKHIDKNATVVFIGPCIAKKSEKDRYEASENVDFVLTFEEMAAMIDSQGIDLSNLESSPLNNASSYGRNFASTGGLTSAIENHIADSLLEADFNPVKCDGINECDKALKLASVKRLNHNFIKGMACIGGCIKGPVTMHHGKADLKRLKEYSEGAIEKTSKDAARIFPFEQINLHR